MLIKQFSWDLSNKHGNQAINLGIKQYTLRSSNMQDNPAIYMGIKQYKGE